MLPIGMSRIEGGYSGLWEGHQKLEVSEEVRFQWVIWK